MTIDELDESLSDQTIKVRANRKLFLQQQAKILAEAYEAGKLRQLLDAVLNKRQDKAQAERGE